MTVRAIILFGHGSRDPLWRQSLEAVAARITVLAPDALVCCAYLELCTPDLPTAVAALANAGADRIRVLPMFLGVGRHARDDLPVLLDAVRAKHPQLQFEVLPAVGEHPRMLALMAELALAPL